MSKASYQEYLQSPHWKKLRSKKWSERSYGKRKPHCCICGVEDIPLDVHHMEYKNLYDVTTDLLRLLCRRCHFAAHDLVRSGKVRWKKKSHYSRFSTLRNATRVHLGLQEPRWKKKKPKNKKIRRLKEKIEDQDIDLKWNGGLLDRILIVNERARARETLRDHKYK